MRTRPHRAALFIPRLLMRWTQAVININGPLHELVIVDADGFGAFSDEHHPEFFQPLDQVDVESLPNFLENLRS